MSSDEGIATAKYVVRCAIPASDGISVVDYTGSLITFYGEIGLAPEWADGQCGTDCQQKVSACLMAFTNGTGEHVDIAMSAHMPEIGDDSPRGWDQEAAFFGNIFFGSNDPEASGAYYCWGDETQNSNTGVNMAYYVPRFCQGYEDGECPFTMAGDSCDRTGREARVDDDDAMKDCEDDDGRSWPFAVTTYVEEIADHAYDNDDSSSSSTSSSDCTTGSSLDRLRCRLGL